MSKRDLVVGAFIVGGLYVWARGATSVTYTVIPSIIGLLETASIGEFLGMAFRIALALALVAIVLFAIGYVLIFKANDFARRLVPEEETELTGVPASRVDGHVVAISVLGVFFFVDGIPPLIGSLVSGVSFAFQSQEALSPATMSYVLSQGVSSLASFIFGTVLFFKASAVAAYWRSKQTGTEQASEVAGVE